MTRTRRLVLAVVGAAAVAAAASQVHVTPARTLTVVGPDGRPLPGAWVAHHYRGRRFATVQSNTWDRPGDVVYADASGEVELPLRIHHRTWPLDSGPERVFDLVYAPSLHNATGPLPPQGRPGRMTVDGDRLVVADLSADPEARLASLQTLYDFVVHDLLADDGIWVGVRPHAAADLANGVKAEYVAFHRDWGAAARPLPAAPPDVAGPQLAAWEERVRADLAYAPRWGDFLADRWKDDLAYMRRRLERHQARHAVPPV